MKNSVHSKILGSDADNFIDHVIYHILSECLSKMNDWNITKSTDESWLHFRHLSTVLPEQGWKLHISASNDSAEIVLRRTLPLLLNEPSVFKVITSLDFLSFMNQGDGGQSQVGKFITIYPLDDSQAVRLAANLDKVTYGLIGPRVPSDRPLHPESLVSYRYGAFRRGLYTQSLNGTILPAIRTPDNGLVPDIRQPRYQEPQWFQDPFLAAGIAVDLPKASRLIKGRYLIMAVITASINHILYLAADLEDAHSCVIKGPGYAWQHSSMRCTSLRHEAEMLSCLRANSHIPVFYDLVEQDGDLFLIMQDLEGETLDRSIANQKKSGHCSLEQAITWMVELADVLEQMHAQGIIYADVKSSNVIIGPQKQIYLIDFEHAHYLGEKNIGGGTPGYMSPQRKSGQIGTIQDDVYGCGALLFFLVTGTEPSLAPNPDELLDRPIELLRPDVGAPLREIIIRALHPDPKIRYTSMREFKVALQDVADDSSQMVRSKTSVFEFCTPQAQINAYYREYARKLQQTLYTVAKRPEVGNGLVWESLSQTGSQQRRDLYIGSSGIVLALAELVAELGDEYACTVLIQGATWLRDAPRLNNQTLPGLYIGEAGVGVALLRTGQVLRQQEFILAAVEQGRLIATLPYTSPDLMTGTAGRLRFHLLLWDETGEQEHLEAALACGENLLNTASMNNTREIYWEIPEGYGSLSNHAYLGYAHGAAGIVDALIDLFVITREERFLTVIQKVGNWLQLQAIPTQDGSGLNWPLAVGNSEIANPFWCHGATGIGRFFLSAATHNLLPDACETAARAAKTVATYGRWLGPTQCHGLAGNIEFLLDMYQAVGEGYYYEMALTLGKLLESFATDYKGLRVFSTEMLKAFTPDYMLGYAGIAVCLLRLSAPERIPHLLSRAGFSSYRHHESSKLLLPRIS